MSEKELLKALEEDAKRECTAILENARQEADAITKAAIEDQERLMKEKFENTKLHMHSERTRMMANARLYANEATLKERNLVLSRVFDIVYDKIDGLRSAKDYPKIFEKLLREALDTWHIYMKGEKGVIRVAKEDAPLLKGFKDANYEIIDEEGNMSPGVIIISKDKRYSILNTLHSRLGKARPEIVSMIDKILFNEKCKL